MALSSKSWGLCKQASSKQLPHDPVCCSAKLSEQLAGTRGPPSHHQPDKTTRTLGTHRASASSSGMFECQHAATLKSPQLGNAPCIESLRQGPAAFSSTIILDIFNHFQNSPTILQEGQWTKLVGINDFNHTQCQRTCFENEMTQVLNLCDCLAQSVSISIMRIF